MTTRYIPLVAPDLISDIDLRPYVYDLIRETSENKIQDFSAHSPVVAITEGLDFSIRELRSVLNIYAQNVAINVLKIAGVQQRLGTSSKVTLTFTLSAPLSNTFVLSSGYIVASSSGVKFATDSILYIYPGSISGTVSATALEVGLAGNVGINSIVSLTETRAYLSSVNNAEAATGGTDEETTDESISRGFESLRTRNSLVTADDFEIEAKTILGEGSIAKAIGNLAADRITAELGAVHLFILNADLSIPNQAQCDYIALLMQSKLPAFLGENKTTLISTGLNVSPVEYVSISLDIVVSMVSGDNPTTRSETIRDELYEYFLPSNLELGTTIILKEVENVIRQCGVQYIQSVFFTSSLGTSYADLPMSNNWSAVKLVQAKVTLVDEFNNPYKYTYIS